MPLPKCKHSKARKRRRQAEQRLSLVGMVRCPRCNQAKLPHHICPNCGYYRDRLVVKMEGI